MPTFRDIAKPVEIEPKIHPSIEREELESHIDEYLKLGRKVEELPGFEYVPKGKRVKTPKRGKTLDITTPRTDIHLYGNRYIVQFGKMKKQFADIEDALDFRQEQRSFLELPFVSRNN